MMTTSEIERSAQITREEPGADSDPVHAFKASVAARSDIDLVRAIRRPKNLAVVRAEQLMAELIDYRGSVIDEAVEFLTALRLPSCLRTLYLQSISEVRALSQVSPCLPAIDLCAAVMRAEGKSVELARPVSIAGLFYYMGISLFDDVIDKDLEPGWTDEFSEAQISFASIAMFSGLPSMALSTLLDQHCSDLVISRMRRWLHEATYEMATGQYLDVRVTTCDATLEACETINHGKTGSTGELAAKLGALAAGASEIRLAGYAEASRKLYVSMQIASDIQDIWCKPISPDLMNGIMTVPIVYALGNLPTPQRGELEQMLGARSNRREAHQTMRDLIASSGALRYTLIAAEQHRLEALAGFEAIAPEAPGLEMLRYFCAAAQLAELA